MNRPFLRRSFVMASSGLLTEAAKEMSDAAAACAWSSVWSWLIWQHLTRSQTSTLFAAHFLSEQMTLQRLCIYDSVFIFVYHQYWYLFITRYSYSNCFLCFLLFFVDKSEIALISLCLEYLCPFCKFLLFLNLQLAERKTTDHISQSFQLLLLQVSVYLPLHCKSS
jgi:hypothetical protein